MWFSFSLPHHVVRGVVLRVYGMGANVLPAVDTIRAGGQSEHNISRQCCYIHLAVDDGHFADRCAQRAVLGLLARHHNPPGAPLGFDAAHALVLRGSQLLLQPHRQARMSPSVRRLLIRRLIEFGVHILVHQSR